MTNSWHNIWSRRNIEFTSDLSLDFLIKADGFDQGIGDVDSDSWISICVAYAKAMDLQKDMSIFEFGCGAGAFLKPFYDIYRMRVAGIDLSPFLIDVARQVMPHGDFNMCSIEDYVFDEKYDVVVSNSVIHYLNREELGTFIDKATAIAERFILISDIPNLQTKTEAEEYRKKSCFKMALRKNTKAYTILTFSRWN